MGPLCGCCAEGQQLLGHLSSGAERSARCMVMVWLMTEGVTEILKGYWNGSIQDEHRIYVLSMFVADQRESPMKF